MWQSHPWFIHHVASLNQFLAPFMGSLLHPDQALHLCPLSYFSPQLSLKQHLDNFFIFFNSFYPFPHNAQISFPVHLKFTNSCYSWFPIVSKQPFAFKTQTVWLNLLWQRWQVHWDVWAWPGDCDGQRGWLRSLRLLARGLSVVFLQHHRWHSPLFPSWQVTRLSQDILRLVPRVWEVQVRHEDLGAQTGGELI